MEMTEISFADVRKNPSLYRKAIAQGLKICLKEYEDLVLGIQRNFLESKHFTFSNIKAELSTYHMILE